MPSVYSFPILVAFPIPAVGTDLARVKMLENTAIYAIEGSLQALASGTFTVSVRDGVGTLVGALTWSAPGLQEDLLPLGPQESVELSFDIDSVGAGAANCYITVWARRGLIDEVQL